MGEKKFPIMIDYSKRTYIPWDVIAPHEAQARRNHAQTLERLAQRGGLSWCEALAVLEDRRWEEIDLIEAESRVNDIVNNFKEKKNIINLNEHMCNYCRPDYWHEDHEMLGEYAEIINGDDDLNYKIEVDYEDSFGGESQRFYTYIKINYCPICGRKLK